MYWSLRCDNLLLFTTLQCHAIYLQEHFNPNNSTIGDSDRITKIKHERDQCAEDLNQVEKQFTELHKRYDRLREYSHKQRKYEDELKSDLENLRQQLLDSSDAFQVHTTEKYNLL